jgi:hypothetical protein
MATESPGELAIVLHNTQCLVHTCASLSSSHTVPSAAYATFVAVEEG